MAVVTRSAAEAAKRRLEAERSAADGLMPFDPKRWIELNEILRSNKNRSRDPEIARRQTAEVNAIYTEERKQNYQLHVALGVAVVSCCGGVSSLPRLIRELPNPRE